MSDIVRMVPRMRTVPQIASEYKAADPNTQINAHFLRGLIYSGKLNVVKAGKKHLINADEFAEGLQTGRYAQSNERVGEPVIRKIRE